MNEAKDKSPLSVRELATLGLLLGILFAAKRVLDGIPNVELVTLLLILYARHVGKPTYLLCLAFTGLECFVYGIHNWVIMYLYMWPLLVSVVLFTKKKGTHGFYCVLSAVFGLFFGALCSIPYFFIGGPSLMLSWWVAGIPFDIVHCISNFILCLVLFRPLDRLLSQLWNTVSA